MAEYQKIGEPIGIDQVKWYTGINFILPTHNDWNLFPCEYWAYRDVDFEDIAKQIMSIVDKSEEKLVCKKDFMVVSCYRSGMKLEPGDISIYAVADQFQKDKRKSPFLLKIGDSRIGMPKALMLWVIDHTQIVDLVWYLNIFIWS